MQSLRSCQIPMITYEASTRMEAPDASPSSPSVRFTPLDVPVTISSTQITNSTGPMEMPKSAMKDRCSDAGVRS